MNATPSRAFALLLIPALFANACSSIKSSYTPTTAAQKEIVWRFDDRLEAVQGGTVIGSAPGFTGLSDVVACVPEAKEEADSAARAAGFGWTSMGIGLAGTLGGGGMAIGGAAGEGDLLIPGLLTMVGSLVV